MRPRTIGGPELRRRLDTGWRPWLVHVGPVDGFARAHLPGAMWIAGVDQLRPLLDAGDPVVLYPSNEDLRLLREWSRQLAATPSGSVWLDTGGLNEWRAAGRSTEP
jgi:hypothetical protein